MQTYRYESQPELVVTVPEILGPDITSRFGLRTTIGVLTELLSLSEHHIIVGAPFIQGEEGLHTGPLGIALEKALMRGVRLDLISSGTSITGLGLHSYRSIAGSKFCIYQPKQNIDNEHLLGSHAKFFMADGYHVYIGSANFTYKGIVKNLEMGVLFHGSSAHKLWMFVQELIDSDYFVEVDN